MADGTKTPPRAATIGSIACRGGGKFTNKELALNLKAYDKEEQRHEGIVDPEVKIVGHCFRAESKRDVRVP
jgi:hypothetical protein